MKENLKTLDFIMDYFFKRGLNAHNIILIYHIQVTDQLFYTHA